MNYRIKELLDASTYDVLGVKQVDQKKFADLIVRECAEIADCHWRNACPGVYVKEHFGVEE
jgi:hypothetical protein